MTNDPHDVSTGAYRRFCPECQTHVHPRIKESREANYHDEDVSPVDCSACGTQLGHVTWWPDEREMP